MESDNNKEDTNILYEISTEVLRVINAIKAPKTEDAEEQGKEVIFSHVSHQINKHEEKTNRSSGRYNIFRLHRTVAASISIIIILSATLSGFYWGHKSSEKRITRNMVEVSAPYGVISRLELPDGTFVTLNGGSTLTYPSLFTTTREVYLSGEGYFEVQKNEKCPFYVNSKHLSVEVLGTVFNFKSYEDDIQSSVTLEQGSVKVYASDKNNINGVLLKPDQQLVLNNKTGEFMYHNIHTPEHIAWKKGDLHFNNLNLTEISVILQRRFGTKINILSEEIANEQYVARFENGENIEEILTLLSEKHAWTFSKQNGIIEINKHKK